MPFDVLKELSFEGYDQLAALITDDEQRIPRARPVDAMEAKKRALLLKRYGELDSIYRSSWEAAHRAIIEFIWPNRGEFDQADANKGFQRDQCIIDNTAGDAGRKLTAALDTGITSEARVWFTLAPEEPASENDQASEAYCHDAQTILFSLIAKSNFYKAHRNVLDDLVGPAIGLMMIEADAEEVFRCTHVPVGSYRVGVDNKGRVNRVVRRFTFTCAQLVEEFGWENCSEAAQRASLNENMQQNFQVLQIIEPRVVRDPKKIDAKSKPWASYWLEVGAGPWNGAGNPAIGENGGPQDGAAQGLLRESGYDVQPFVCPRWNSLGMDAYGKDSPAWVSLGDVMALQALQLEGATNIARIGTPPLTVPDELRNASLLPNAINYVKAGQKAEVTPTVVIPPEAVTVIQEEKKEHRARIVNAHYGDVLFLISNGGQSAEPATAEEIRGKKAEQLLQLGGVFSRLSDEDLKITVAVMFHHAQAAKKFPPPPPQLAKKGKIKLGFQNPLVSAQKAVEFGGIQQWFSILQAGAELKHAGVDQVDFDEFTSESREMLGVNPKLEKNTDQLAQERQAQQQAAQAQQQAAALQAGAPAVKALSDANPDRLQQIAGMFGANAGAQAGAGMPQ